MKKKTFEKYSKHSFNHYGNYNMIFLDLEVFYQMDKIK